MIVTETKLQYNTINCGKFNTYNGNNSFGWSLYDKLYNNCYILISGRHWILTAKNHSKVGDEILLKNYENHNKNFKFSPSSLTINKIIKCNESEIKNHLRLNGYQVIKPKAFQRRTNPLFDGYIFSTKGIETKFIEKRIVSYHLDELKLIHPDILFYNDTFYFYQNQLNSSQIKDIKKNIKNYFKEREIKTSIRKEGGTYTISFPIT